MQEGSENKYRQSVPMIGSWLVISKPHSEAMGSPTQGSIVHPQGQG